MQKTRLSSKGQIVLPNSIRDAQSWQPGMEFTVERAEAAFSFVQSAPFRAPRSRRWPDACRRGASLVTPAGCERPSIEKYEGGMNGVDTDVLIRLLTGDDPAQTAAARSLFESAPTWIAKTILLETAWVLRSFYGFEEGAICTALIKCWD